MINFFKKFFLVFIVLTLLSTSLTWSLFKKSSKITVTGSTTVLPIAQACAEYYMKNKNKKAEITVSVGGSSVGIAAVLDGRADIGDASRNAKDKEVKAAKEKGIDLYKNNLILFIIYNEIFKNLIFIFSLIIMKSQTLTLKNIQIKIKKLGISQSDVYKAVKWTREKKVYKKNPKNKCT